MAFLGWCVNGEWQTEPPKEWLEVLEQAFVETLGLVKKEGQGKTEKQKAG